MSGPSSRPHEAVNRRSAIADRHGQPGEPAMYPDHLPTDAKTHATAVRIARRCRHVVQACLREEEWADADREFYRIVREELATTGGPAPATSLGEQS